MRKLKMVLISLGLLSLASMTAIAQTTDANSSDMSTTANGDAAKQMTPPPPVNNKVYDAMVGTWRGTSDMMGTKMSDVIRIRWVLNHQFLVMGLTSTNIAKPSEKYEGMGVFGIDSQGNAKTWWFDSWGADAMSTGTGQFSDNTLTLTDSNAMFSETRTFTIHGNQMTMHAKGTMTWQGKTNQFDTTTVYKK